MAEKTGTAKNRDGWLRDPKALRPEETIGGGYFIFRRGDSTGRIRPSLWPFEHARFDKARAEAARLATEMPGYQFDVVGVLHSARSSDARATGESDT